jgi:hypothetical protein
VAESSSVDGDGVGTVVADGRGVLLRLGVGGQCVGGRLVATHRSSRRCSAMKAGGGAVQVETSAVQWRAALAVSGGLGGGGSCDKGQWRERLLVAHRNGKKAR